MCNPSARPQIACIARSLCHAQDDFVATLLRQCAGLEEELARTPATLESGTSISSDRESTKAAEAEQDAIRFEQERKLAELNDESSAYEAVRRPSTDAGFLECLPRSDSQIISELRAEAQSRFAQVSQLSEAVSALTVTSAKPPAPALPDTTPPAFTLCLINGYGLLLASLPGSNTDKLVSSAMLHHSPTVRFRKGIVADSMWQRACSTLLLPIDRFLGVADTDLVSQVGNRERHQKYVPQSPHPSCAYFRNHTDAMPNVDRHSQEHPLHGGLLVFFFHDEDKSVARLVQRRAVACAPSGQIHHTARC